MLKKTGLVTIAASMILPSVPFTIYTNTALAAEAGDLSSIDGWQNEDVTVTLTENPDALSGVNRVEYRLDSGNWMIYTDPFVISKEGSTLVESRSIDNAGNTSSTASQTIKIDKTAPSKPNLALSTVDWTNDTITLSVNGSADMTAIRYQYRINGGTWITSNTGSITTEGENVVEARAVDSAANASATSSAVAKIDKTAPVVSISKSPDSTDWLENEYKYTMSASDPSSGVKDGSLYYQMTTSPNQPSSGWMPYNGEVSLKDEGEWYFHGMAEDNAGNKQYGTSSVSRLQYAPDKPDNFVTTSIGNKTASLNWDLVNGRSYLGGYSYLLKNLQTGQVNNLTYPSSHTDITGLEGGTSYDYSLTIKNHVGEASTTLSLLTLPDSPQDIKTSGMDRIVESATATWSPVKSATSYYIVVNKTDGTKVYEDTVTGTSSPISGLEAGTVYNVFVSAINATGEGNSSSSSFLSVPNAPTGFSTTSIFSDSILLGWDKVQSARGYLLYRNAELVYGSVSRDTYGNVTSDTYGGQDTTFNDTGLESGTTYNYRLSAVNDTGESESSSLQDIITLPGQVKNIKPSTVGDDSLSVVWDSVKGSSGYIVKFDDGSEETINTNNYTASSLESGTAYPITVTAFNKSGRGESQQASITTLPASIGDSSVQVSSIEESTADLSWPAVKGATRYRVSVDGKEYEVSGTAFSVVGLKGGVSYSAKVEAGNENGFGKPSSKQFLTKPGSVLGLSIKNSTAHMVSADWDDVQSAEGYIIYVDGSEVGRSSTSDHKITGLDSGKEYDIQVSAINSTGEGSKSSIQYTTPTESINKSELSVDPEVTTITMQWAAVKGASAYKVFDSNGNEVYSGKMLTYTSTGLAGGQLYKYSIVAINGTGLQSDAVNAQALTKPDKPNGSYIGSVDKSSLQIFTGESIGEVDGYTVYRGNKLVGYVTNGSIVDKNLDPATEYTYTIIPKNSSGDGYGTTIKGYTATDSVLDSSIKVVPDTRFVDVSWKEVEGAKEYIITDSTGIIVWRGSDINTRISDLTPGTTYEWNLQVINGEGSSSAKTPFTVLTKPDSIIAGSVKLGAIDTKSIELLLSDLPSSGYTDILIYRDGEQVAKLPIGTAAFKDEGLIDNTNYVYTVYLQNKSGRSDTPDTLEAMTRKEKEKVVVTEPTTQPVQPEETPITTPTQDPVDKPNNDKDDSKEDAAKQYPFEDINATYNKDEIAVLYDRGILKGTSTSSFEPNRPITRMEFASLIVRAMDAKYEGEVTLPWKDVEEKAWYTEELKSAHQNGIVHGFSKKIFNPNMIINREQAAKMLANSLYGNTDDHGSLGFVDKEKVAAWAKNEVKVLSDGSIIKGFPDNTFRPKENLTRADSVSLIYNMIMEKE